MANQKATVHEIPLKTMDLCLNRYNADIKDYSGFRENNSPFFGNTLSPFYYKHENVLSGKSHIYKDGTIYSLKSNGSLAVKSNVPDSQFEDVISVSDSKFLVRETNTSSKNEDFPRILTYVHFQDGQDPYLLCASHEGQIAIVNSEGTVIRAVTEGWYTYEPGEVVQVAQCIPDSEARFGGLFLFVIGNKILYMDANGTFHQQQSFNRTYETAVSCVKSGKHFIVCVNSMLTGKSRVYNTIDATSSPIVLVETVNCKISGATAFSVVAASQAFSMFFNAAGNTILYSGDWKQQVSGLYRIYSFATNVTYVNNTTISIDIDSNNHYDMSDISHLSFEMKSGIRDNYACTAVIGQGGATYDIQHPEEWGVETVPIIVTTTVTKQIPIGIVNYQMQYITIEVPEVHVVGYETKPVLLKEAWVETKPGNYNIQFIDGSNKTTYSGVGINIDGTYRGGTYAKIGNSFRALYHDGEMQGVSVCTDDLTVGTLLCVMTGLDTTSVVTTGIGSKGEYITYKDTSGQWNTVVLSTNPNDASIKVANDRYLILNVNNYYNCFDMVEHRPYHFASDWNDRAIITTNTNISSSEATTFNSYMSLCEAYTTASDERISQTPTFVSTQYPRNSVYLSKKATDFKIILQAGSTPNDQDINIYYSRLAVSNNPAYVCSVDSNSNIQEGTRYINSALSGSQYVEIANLAIVPSIFAEFLSGFTNQGIVQDNGHNYLQAYLNSYIPTFAVSLANQLEGVSNAFIIQGRYFVIIAGSIYSYDPSTMATSAIVNIGDMQLVGYTPYQAIFWSLANKTFYTFTGDNILETLVQADEVDTIRYSVYNNNTCSIYILTNTCIYIFGSEQLMKLRLPDYTKAFPLNTGMALTSDVDTLYVSYNRLEGYTAAPIELETEFYGMGNSIKSVNDSVRIRLFDEEMRSGKVKLQVETLNEGAVKTEEVIVNITPEKWDKITKTAYILYQPKNQRAAGFSVKIRSPFSIASLQISATPDTLQESNIKA